MPASPTNPQRSRFQSPHLGVDLSLPVICPSPSCSHTAAATPASTSRANTHTRHAHAYRAGRQWHSQHSHGRSTRHGTGLYFIMAAARHSTLDFMLSATGEPPHSGDSPFLAYPPTHGCLTGPSLFFLPFLSNWGEERSERLAARAMALRRPLHQMRQANERVVLSRSA